MEDDASSLATQETSLKKSVYITNLKKQTEETPNDSQNNRTKLNEEEDQRKKPPAKDRPLERSSSINSNNDLEDYEESGSENDQAKETEKKNPKKTK